eukprot:1827734-Lingulodinium_polyedra.AAC.1
MGCGASGCAGCCATAACGSAAAPAGASAGERAAGFVGATPCETEAEASVACPSPAAMACGPSSC